MKPILIRLLGRFDLETPMGGREHLTGTKTLLLLARLALPPGQAHDRKKLTELLWPDRGEAQALASLRQSLWSLRKGLGEADPPPIHAERASIRLDPAAVDVDVIEFERLIRSGAEDDLERAAEIYRGDFLTEIDLDDSDAYSAFLFERRRLRDMALSCMNALIETRTQSGDLDGAVTIAERALSFDPLQEDVHAAIIRLHRDRGRLGLARDQYEACRDILKKELNVAPSAAIEALRQSLGLTPNGRAAPEAGQPVSTPLPFTMSAQPKPSTPRRSLLLLGLPAIVAGLTVAFLSQTTSSDPVPAPQQAISIIGPSLVVLPFEDLSVDGQQAVFAAGLTDDLITDLAKVSDLFVIASDTSRSLASSTTSARELADALGVDFAVTGTVRRSRGMIQVTVQLTEVATGHAIWAERYDRQATDLYDVQNDVVQSVVEALEIELSDQERRTIARIPTDNLEAHDFYQRAEYQTVGMNEADTFTRSIAAYRHAIELDPDFAEAYAGYARVAVTIWRRGFDEIMPSVLAKQEAYAAAGRALELDPENARAFEVLSIIQAVDGEHAIAIDSAQKAVGLQPGDAEAHTNLATVLYIVGDLEQAAAEVETARRLNPALSTDLRFVSGTVAFARGRYADAIAEFNAVREYLPGSDLVLEHLAASYAYLGDLERAAETVAALKEVLPVTNLGLYAVLRSYIGTPDQTAHFIEGLRLAGIPEWPYDIHPATEDRLGQEELRTIAAGPAWTGELENGADFVQYFDTSGGFAYRSTISLLTGHVFIHDDQLCQISDGYFQSKPTCGYVYRTAAGEGRPDTEYAYESVDAVKYFSVSD